MAPPAAESIEDEIKNEKNPRPLDEDDIALLKTYKLGPYSTTIKNAEKEIKDMAKKINDLYGIKEYDTGLAAPSQWDLVSDKQMMQEEQPLQVARCTKIINPNFKDLMNEIENYQLDFKEMVERSLTNLNVHLAAVTEQVEELRKQHKESCANFDKKKELMLQEIKMIRLDSAKLATRNLTFTNQFK